MRKSNNWPSTGTPVPQREALLESHEWRGRGVDFPGHSWTPDRFTLILLVLIDTLLLVTLISVLSSRTRAGIQGVLQYRTDNSPEAVVHNRYVALQRNNLNRYIPLFALERWQLLRRQEDHILYGHQEEGQIGMKVVDATITDTTALVTVATIHTGGTYPKYPKSGFFLCAC